MFRSSVTFPREWEQIRVHATIRENRNQHDPVGVKERRQLSSCLGGNLLWGLFRARCTSSPRHLTTSPYGGKTCPTTVPSSAVHDGGSGHTHGRTRSGGFVLEALLLGKRPVAASSWLPTEGLAHRSDHVVVLAVVKLVDAPWTPERRIRHNFRQPIDCYAHKCFAQPNAFASIRRRPTSRYSSNSFRCPLRACTASV